MNFVLLETFKDEQVQYLKTYRTDDINLALRNIMVEHGGLSVNMESNGMVAFLKCTNRARQFSLIPYAGEAIDRASIYAYNICYSRTTMQGIDYQYMYIETGYPVVTNKDVLKLTNQLRRETSNQDVNVISYNLLEERFTS